MMECDRRMLKRCNAVQDLVILPQDLKLAFTICLYMDERPIYTTVDPLQTVSQFKYSVRDILPKPMILSRSISSECENDGTFLF